MNSIQNTLFTEGLLIHEILHGIIAVPFAIFLYKKTRSQKLVLFLFLTTYFMDLDHLIDYFLFYGFTFNLSDFLNGMYFEFSNRAFVFFHAWEWIIILYFITLKKEWKSYCSPIFLGMLPHLILDAFHVQSFLFYSIIFRSISGFANL